jgi:hypothetical protein
LNFKGAVKSPLLIPAKSKLAIIATLRIILAAPLQSALIFQPLPDRYNPRLTRLPDGSQPSGFSPYLGRASESRKLALEDCQRVNLSKKTTPQAT